MVISYVRAQKWITEENVIKTKSYSGQLASMNYGFGYNVMSMSYHLRHHHTSLSCIIMSSTTVMCIDFMRKSENYMHQTDGSSHSTDEGEEGVSQIERLFIFLRIVFFLHFLFLGKHIAEHIRTSYYIFSLAYYTKKWHSVSIMS